MREPWSPDALDLRLHTKGSAFANHPGSRGKVPGADGKAAGEVGEPLGLDAEVLPRPQVEPGLDLVEGVVVADRPPTQHPPEEQQGRQHQAREEEGRVASPGRG